MTNRFFQLELYSQIFTNKFDVFFKTVFEKNCMKIGVLYENQRFFLKDIFKISNIFQLYVSVEVSFNQSAFSSLSFENLETTVIFFNKNKSFCTFSRNLYFFVFETFEFIMII